MNKRGWIFWVSIIVVVLLVFSIFVYMALFKSNNESLYAGRTINNPVVGLNDSQALAAFDESFVYYLLYSIKAYNLHEVPLSSDYPKILIDVNDAVYNAAIKKGEIGVSKGAITDMDIIIKTTKEEAIKMMRDSSYVTKSFNDGLSGIELSASKTTLFAKGYLNMYTQLTGKSITGNFIRISTG